MPVIDEIEQLHDEMVGWRRDLHAHPELGFHMKAVPAPSFKNGCSRSPWTRYRLLPVLAWWV